LRRSEACFDGAAVDVVEHEVSGFQVLAQVRLANRLRYGHDIGLRHPPRERRDTRW
jgi:hypothetical protein